MSNQKRELTVTELIDADEGLKSKRKLLTITSLILLLISFSDAKVLESNTFIVKIGFGNQDGVSLFLVFTVFLLLIRYYNYACKYHYQIHEVWSKRMLRHNFFISSNPNEFEYYGLISEMEPEGFNYPEIMHEGRYSEFKYHCSFPLVRKIVYIWQDQFDDYEVKVWMGWRKYFKVLSFELYFRIKSFLVDRENLDIIAPYTIGIMAIFSYFLNEKFQSILQVLAVS